MTYESFRLQSEKYSASGNLAADGFRKLLGAPALNLLQTVVRESVQNSVDAAKNGVGPEMLFRLRRLDESQKKLLRNTVFRYLPESDDSRNPLKNFMDQDEPWVFEICDFNTTGLTGPTRADIIPHGNTSTDFIDFLRNVGSPRDTETGGGTYGYGKTSFYLVSRCSTILIDSQTTFMDSDTRRVMACHLGSAFDNGDGYGNKIRFTGRHWWGIQSSDSDDFVEPLENDNASSFSTALGLPIRTRDKKGTTILIPDPVFLGVDGESPEEAMGMIAESLLWYFWPRMIEGTEPGRRIKLRLELDNKEYPLPVPENFPPLDIFADAMKTVRKKDSSVKEIRYDRYNKRLGFMNISKNIRLDRSRLVTRKENTIIPDIASHIAVMRPVELVVRYYQGEPLTDRRFEWGGIFISDDDPDIESAFSMSEPPAHDDWQPGILPKGVGATCVRAAIREIKKEASLVAVPVSLHPPLGDSGPSLAYSARKMGRMLGINSLQTEHEKKTGRTQKNRKKANRISQPVFVRLEYQNSERIAIFECSIYNDGTNDQLSAVASACLVMDGGALSGVNLQDTQPLIKTWKSEDGDLIGHGSTIVLNGYNGIVEISTTVPVNCAVTLDVKLLSGGTL